MGADSAVSEHQDTSRRKFARDFERAVNRARWAGYAERLWNKGALPIGGLTSLFLAASWSGAVWPNMPPSMRAASVVLFGVAAIASALPLFKVKPLNRAEAIDRMDKENGPGRPASTYDDIPASDNLSPESKAVWDLERKRIEKKIGQWKAGAPRSGLFKLDPWGLRMMMGMLTGIMLAGAYNQDQVGERITAAFDWKAQAPYTGPAKIDAWVKPPEYTDKQAVYIAHKDKPEHNNGAEFAVPAKSVLTLLVHEKNIAVKMEGAASTVKDSCEISSSKGQTKCEFELSGDAALTIRRGEDAPLTWHFNVTPDLPPSVTIAPAPQQPDSKKPSLSFTYEVKDDLPGADIKELELEIAPPTDPEATPLPLFNVPAVTVPVR